MIEKPALTLKHYPLNHNSSPRLVHALSKKMIFHQRPLKTIWQPITKNPYSF